MKYNKKDVELELSLPDFKSSDLNISVNKNSISVKAEKKMSKKIQRKDFFHSEKSAQNFNYFTSIPSVDSKRASIQFKKGILKIKVPRV